MVDSVSYRCLDVATVFAAIVTRWGVVADGERQGCGGVDVAQAVAHHGRAADVSGVLPDNLGEVAPFLEVGHARVGLAVRGREVANLVIVHQVGDQNADLALLHTVTDVLAVTTAINGARRGMLVKLEF